MALTVLHLEKSGYQPFHARLPTIEEAAPEDDGPFSALCTHQHSIC
jgi:hypothetical protein